ncbi:uroporphyrinogen decarboxylase/cobalamine-independent methonine synthase family protein [Nesterenkonia suensis]
MSSHDPADAVLAAAGGVMPGTDALRSAEHLETELTGHLPALAELPCRGHHASLHGRAISLLTELPAELTSYGWRLVDRPGADHRRALQLLRADVDTLADVRGARAEAGVDDHPAELLLHVLGPVSLAAQLALPGGEKVLVDHGARRDLAESLAAGIQDHLEHVRRSCSPAALHVVLHEPDHARVRSGSVPTVSGYRTIRALPRDETRRMVDAVVDALRAGGADEVLLDLGEAPQRDQVEDHLGSSNSPVDGFGLPLPDLAAGDWERTAELAEQGTRFLAGLLPSVPRTHQDLPPVSALLRRITDPWQALGMSPSALATMRMTPMVGRARAELAQVGEADAMRLISRVRDAAEALTETMHS